MAPRSPGEPLSVRLYRVWLRLLPQPFRREYAEEILMFHQERLLHESIGPVDRVVTMMNAYRDVLSHAVRERAVGFGSGSTMSPGHGSGLKPEGRWGWARGFARDVRYAVRSVLRAPGFSIAFVLTLGLGIGANTAIFSLVRGVLLKPLPHDDGDRIVYLRQTASIGGATNVLFSVPEIDDYREGATSFTEVAEFSALTFTMLGDGDPLRVRTGIVTGNYFDVMGLRAVVGRTLGREDDGGEAAPTAVLTYEFWTSQFGADPNVLGRTVQLGPRTLDIVGVLEPAPHYPERTDLLVNMVSSPHHLSATMNADRSHRMTEVFARMRPESSLDRARAELDAITERIHQEHSNFYDAASGITVNATLLKDQLTQDARLTLLMLLGTAGFVLVIACANVANLMLTRSVRRERELAVRSALGAGRVRLRRMLFAEALLLALVGGGLGLLLAWGGLDILVAFTSRFTARAAEIQVDGVVLTAALTVASGAALLLAFVPGMPGLNPNGGGGSGTRLTGGMARRRLQQGLVVTEVAVAFAVLIGATLLLRTVRNLQDVDAGFGERQVLTMGVARTAGAGLGPDDIRVFYETALNRIQALPGVEAAAVSTIVPLRDQRSNFTSSVEVAVEGRSQDPDQAKPRADFRVVTPDYFRTLGIALVAGRYLDQRDGAEADKAVVINETMAAQYFNGLDPVGRRIRWDNEGLRFAGISLDWRTVVGVVSDTKDYALDESPGAIVYQPFGQELWASALLVQTSGDASVLTRQVVDVIRNLRGDQPIEDIRTLAEIRSDNLAPQRLNATLTGLFGGLALAIASVGVFGVLAFSVAQRTREFGIRVTLGADRNRVMRQILHEGTRMVGSGVVIGAVIALALSRFLTGLLFDVTPSDPTTFGVVGLVILLVGVAAVAFPAWRAARVEPVVALRAE